MTLKPTFHSLCLTLGLLAMTTGGVMAQTWTTVSSSTFAGAATTATAGADNTTAVPPFRDHLGGVWYLSGTTLASTVGNNFFHAWLLRPSSENALTQRVQFTTAGANATDVDIALLRVNTSGTDSAYAAYIDQSGNFKLAKLVNGVQTFLNTGTFTRTSGHDYVVSFQCLPDPTAGTDLQATVADASAPATILATVAAAGDTTASLQSAGGYGFASLGTPALHGLLNLITYSSPAFITSGRTTASAITPQLNGIAGGTPPYSTVFSFSPSPNGTYTQVGTAVTGTNPVASAAATGLTASTTYYFRAVTTDGAGTPVVTTYPSATTGTPLATTATTASIVASGSLTAGGSSQTFTVTGTNTAWTAGTPGTPTFAVSGGAGTRLLSQVVNSPTSATVTLNPGTAVGSLTVTAPDTGASTTIAVAAVPTTGKITFVGDSLTSGFNASSGNGTVTGTTYPADVIGLLGTAWTGVNLGVSGKTLSQMITDAQVAGGAYNPIQNFDGTKSYNVAVILGGHNDYNAGSTSATVYSRQVQLCGLFRAAGYKVVICTEPPAAYPSYPSNFDSLRDASNASLRANWRSFADGLADLASNTAIGPSGSEYNTAYYSAADNTHMTDAGYSVFAQCVAPQVAAVGSSSIVSAVTLAITAIPTRRRDRRSSRSTRTRATRPAPTCWNGTPPRSAARPRPRLTPSPSSPPRRRPAWGRGRSPCSTLPSLPPRTFTTTSSAATRACYALCMSPIISASIKKSEGDEARALRLLPGLIALVGGARHTASRGGRKEDGI